MALSGQGALAMWWDIAPQHRAAFEHWHTREHFAERLGVPGFLRGSRWTALRGEPHYFVMYELADLGVLTSPAYRERLNNPTPWTLQTMANFRNMTRSQCRVACSAGAGMGQAMLTVRFSPAEGQADVVQSWMRKELLPSLMAQPAICAVHVLQNMVAPVPLHEQTAEQKLRGGDATADWILLVNGHDRAQLSALADDALQAKALLPREVPTQPQTGLYEFAYAMTTGDLAVHPGVA